MYPDIGQCKSPGKSKSMQKVDDLNRERKEECSHPVWNRNAGMPRYLGCDRTLTLRYHKACNQIFPCFDLGRVKAMYKPSHTTKINKQTNKQNQNQNKTKKKPSSSFCGNVTPFLILLNHNSVSQQLKQSFHSNI